MKGEGLDKRIGQARLEALVQGRTHPEPLAELVRGETAGQGSLALRVPLLNRFRRVDGALRGGDADPEPQHIVKQAECQTELIFQMPAAPPQLAVHGRHFSLAVDHGCRRAGPPPSSRALMCSPDGHPLCLSGAPQREPVTFTIPQGIRTSVVSTGRTHLLKAIPT